jgi:hypothetical protein
MVGRQKKFSPFSSGAVVGSRMDKNQDPGYNIPDPQHCLELELGSAEVLRHGEHIGQDLVGEAHQPTVLDVRRLVLSTRNHSVVGPVRIRTDPHHFVGSGSGTASRACRCGSGQSRSVSMPGT